MKSDSAVQRCHKVLRHSRRSLQSTSILSFIVVIIVGLSTHSTVVVAESEEKVPKTSSLFLERHQQQVQQVILGAPGNTCADDREKVTTVAACKKAKEEVSLSHSTWNGKEEDSDWPSGCYFCDDVSGCVDGTWFNKDTTGSANGNARPLCALPTWPGCNGGASCGYNDDDDDDDDIVITIDTLLAGDSDMEYWPANMWKKAFDINKDGSAVNEGVGGWTCAKLNKQISGFLTKHQPSKWVVLVCGENDLANHGSVSKAFSKFQSVVNKIFEFPIHTSVRVLYIGTKPEPSTKSLHEKYREYDNLIRNWAAELSSRTTPPPLIMIDSYKGFEDLGNSNEFYRWDRLHLSKRGYKKWTKWSRAAILEAATSPCTVWQGTVCTQQ